ncbi:hypothetical protein [Kitasatospora purpeofusca]|uniref:hypothetical protein n=1 Tax=Kitasatospora purpeofusca TaxID=67352 RepID=UPI0037FB0FA0
MNSAEESEQLVIPGRGVGEQPYELVHPAALKGPAKWRTLSKLERERQQDSWRARMTECKTWAEVAGVRLGPGTGDGDPAWLLRSVARRSYDGCRPSWLDHPLFWVQGRRPAAITASLYDYDLQAPEIRQWLEGKPGIGLATGPGWYHSGTVQVVLWRRDLLGDDVKAADAGAQALSWLTPSRPGPGDAAPGLGG